MASTQKRTVIVTAADGLKAEFHALKALQSAKHQRDVQDRIEKFNEYKRLIPPRRLPDDMNDHKLGGGLSEFSECHLAGDMLLVYVHEDDVVYMLSVCRHEDLYEKDFRVHLRARKRQLQDKLGSNQPRNRQSKKRRPAKKK